ncbi:rhodanese-like domain-containing protein [Aquibacillus koreensis]|uniref:Rhodanese-like domain-containing protein n=1 Tax=Aquibacillus koreensis TaxID=279446 RepID=A0A9X4AIT6_9BACI|nr:rhodanese-like domain-containing protein [Aquibacillus koreensis]MCT2536333.1 rhodanese-like domain-containing protein [Aquibacillus koreensis]MDC3421316.1 rhodanese-like domain-containing protein [Aquibacillus koreensis]
MKEVTPEQVLELLNNKTNVNIIDVREDEEVATGMIPDAKHIPLGFVEASMDELDKEKDYIIVCRSGRRSANACMFLESEGFKVSNMVGGMLEWEGPTK